MENKNRLICKNPKDMQVYIVQVSDGQPDWSTAKPFDEIKSVDVEANDAEHYALSLADITELMDTASEEDTVQRLKQHHYDETHSRKANWHKRYF